MKSTIHPAITGNAENTLVKRVPQRLIIGKPISQYALYSEYVLSVTQQYQRAA